MKLQNPFSHGLLYSVSPENLIKLHLNDESNLDDFSWDESGTQSENNSWSKEVLSSVRTMAARLGIVKH